MRTAILAALLAVTACKSANEKKCDHYVDLQIKCGEGGKVSEQEKDAMEMMVGGMCVAALEHSSGDVSGSARQLVDEIHASIRREVACLDKVTTCDQWQACQDKGDVPVPEPTATE